MSDYSKINVNDMPKRHCDGAICGHGQEIFMFGLVSGNEVHGFSATPRVMKLIAMLLADQITVYEKNFGPINVQQPQIKSPFQVTDFKKPPEGNTDL